MTVEDDVKAMFPETGDSQLAYLRKVWEETSLDEGDFGDINDFTDIASVLEKVQDVIAGVPSEFRRNLYTKFLMRYVQNRQAELADWVYKLESGIVTSEERKRTMMAVFFQRIIRGEMEDESGPALKATARQNMNNMLYNAKSAVFGRFADRCRSVGM